MLRNTLFSKAVCIATIYAFTSAILPKSAHAVRGLAPISFDEMYSLAQNGQVEALRASVYRGLNIDTVNSDGDTGLCIAARRHDVYTYNSFRAAGAEPRHPCTHKISDYNDFLEKSNVVGLGGTSREALSAMGNKDSRQLVFTVRLIQVDTYRSQFFPVYIQSSSLQKTFLFSSGVGSSLGNPFDHAVAEIHVVAKKAVCNPEERQRYGSQYSYNQHARIISLFADLSKTYDSSVLLLLSLSFLFHLRNLGSLIFCRTLLLTTSQIATAAISRYGSA